MSRENTSPFAGGRDSSLTSSPFRHAWRQKSAVLWSFSCPRYDIIPGSEAAQVWRWRNANHGSIGDSRRGAALWLCWVIRGSIWCPVRLGAGGAHSLTRPGYLPSNPSAQNRIDDRGHDSGLSFGSARSSGLWLQIFGVEGFSFLPNMQSDGRNLARQGQASQLGL